jgi:hypothetical protein
VEPIAYEELARRRGGDAIRQIDEFFAGTDPVHRTLRKIAARLEQLRVPYAVVGAMALNAHGYRRATVDVDVLVSTASVQVLFERLVGDGYTRASKLALRDLETAVRVECVVSDLFPDPASVANLVGGVKYIGLTELVALKLKLGTSYPGRLKHLGDVQELIKILRLPGDLADHLDEQSRSKYRELWDPVARSGYEP